MRIYYGEALGKQNVDNEHPVEETLEGTLSLLRSLDMRRGFLGVLLKDPYGLQFAPDKGKVRIELLDSSVPSMDWAKTDVAFAEELIKAADAGLDVFEIAKNSTNRWEHLKFG